MKEVNPLNVKLIEQYRVRVMQLLDKVAEAQAEINTLEAMIRELQHGR